MEVLVTLNMAYLLVQDWLVSVFKKLLMTARLNFDFHTHKHHGLKKMTKKKGGKI